MDSITVDCPSYSVPGPVEPNLSLEFPVTVPVDRHARWKFRSSFRFAGTVADHFGDRVGSAGPGAEIFFRLFFYPCAYQTFILCSCELFYGIYTHLFLPCVLVCLLCRV